MKLKNVYIQYVNARQITLGGRLELEEKDIVVFGHKNKRIKNAIIRNLFNLNTPSKESSIELKVVNAGTVSFYLIVGLDSYVLPKNWAGWLSNDDLKLSLQARTMPEHEFFELSNLGIVQMIREKHKTVELNLAI